MSEPSLSAAAQSVKFQANLTDAAVTGPPTAVSETTG
jgi:hypothetical protein